MSEFGILRPQGVDLTLDLRCSSDLKSPFIQFAHVSLPVPFLLVNIIHEMDHTDTSVTNDVFKSY